MRLMLQILLWWSFVAILFVATWSITLELVKKRNEELFQQRLKHALEIRKECRS
jgi:hypothetical protein